MPVRPEPVGDGRPRQAGEVAEASNAELGELPAALGRQWQKVERQRLEEELRLAIVDDDDAVWRGDARCSERGEASGGGADPRLPLGPSGVERAPENLPEASREPLDPARLEVDAAWSCRLYGEAGLLEPAQ